MKIIIHRLKVEPFIGVYTQERRHRQPIVITLELTCQTVAAVYTDKIKDTLDYDYVVQQIEEVVASSAFHLIERLAQEILNKVIQHPLVKEAVITLDKPHAIAQAEKVSVTLSAKTKD